MRNSVHDIFIILSQQILNYKMLVAITSGQKSDFSSRFILIAFLFNEKKKKKSERVFVLQNHPTKQTFTNKLRLHI